MSIWKLADLTGRIRRGEVTVEGMKDETVIEAMITATALMQDHEQRYGPTATPDTDGIWPEHEETRRVLDP